MKRSNDDLSVRDELDVAPTGGRLHPSIMQNRTPEGLGRWGMRGMEDFSVEELAQLHQKLEGWIRPAGPRPRAPTAPAVGHEAQNGPFGVRGDASGSHRTA
jgi:hypothetical protein